MQNVEYLIMILYTSDLILRSLAISTMFLLRMNRAYSVFANLLSSFVIRTESCTVVERPADLSLSVSLPTLSAGSKPVAANRDTFWTFCFLHVNFPAIISNKLENKPDYVWDASFEARDKKMLYLSWILLYVFLLNWTTFTVSDAYNC